MSPAEIVGVVVDDDGRPVSEARVHIVDGPVPVPDIAALTDSDGRFVLSAPSPGTYVLGVAADTTAGLVEDTLSVEAPPAGETSVELRLRRGD